MSRNIMEDFGKMLLDIRLQRKAHDWLERFKDEKNRTPEFWGEGVAYLIEYFVDDSEKRTMVLNGFTIAMKVLKKVLNSLGKTTRAKIHKIVMEALKEEGIK